MASIINASSTGSGGIVQTADASGVLQLQTNGTNVVTVDSTTKVGIGNTVPDLPLDVYGSAGVNGEANRVMVLQTNNTATAGYGGGIAFGGFYNGTSNRINDFAGIQGFKENGTANDYAGALRFTTRVNGGSPTESLRINSNANVILRGGTTTANGVGLTFPATQVASTNANCLDDYEEGTFLPAFDIPSGSVTYGTQTAHYIKIGRLVQCTIALGLSAISSPSGSITIAGLPFTNGNGENFVSAFSVALSRNFASAFVITGYIGSNSTALQVSKNASNTGFSPVVGSDLLASTQLYVTLTYVTA